MLVVRCGQTARAYVNACPHQWLPLTFRSANVVSRDRERLRCSNHFAEFAIADGHALSGPAPAGSGLDPVPVHVDGQGEVVIGERPASASGSAP
jgi:nitrite reductase/ring-hydroxylating ferredoxin subunit